MAVQHRTLRGRLMQQDVSMSAFVTEMTGITTRCLGHSVSPKLQGLRQELNELR
jgi:hypothetical protein